MHGIDNSCSRYVGRLQSVGRSAETGTWGVMINRLTLMQFMQMIGESLPFMIMEGLLLTPSSCWCVPSPLALEAACDSIQHNPQLGDQRVFSESLFSRESVN